jgi:excisionase family DNA binding protein
MRSGRHGTDRWPKSRGHTEPTGIRLTSIDSSPGEGQAKAKLRSALSAEVVDALELLVKTRVHTELARAADVPSARPWLTLDEAAEQLGCSPDAVRMRVNRGRLEHRRHGRRLYVSRASLDRLA